MRVVFAIALALSCAATGCTSKNPSGGTGGNGGTSGGDDMGVPCGNGMLDPGEQCDDGMSNGTPGDGCTQFCRFTCNADADCDDKNACNGAETCSDHACKPGTPPADGTACGSGMLCRAGTCVASRCGDGIVTPPEECDDGNVTDGDGCDSDCKFSCTSSDPSRDCAPMDACAGKGTCNDTTHVCTAGTPLPDGSMCGSGNDYCKGGKCTMPTCGNGVKEPGEDCDDGGLNGTKNDGCTTMCKLACVNPSTDCGAPPACEKFSCTTMHVCLAGPDASQNGMSCGSNLVCKDGACIAPTATCGNGVVEGGEDCDFGSGNGPNTGCESNCKFSCTSNSGCDDGNACNGSETCDPVTVNGQTGHKCDAGTPLSDGTACGTGKICLMKVCQTSVCGDGYVDGSKGETCDPPNLASGCDSHCHLIKCGDGTLEDTEQCDDGNLVNLDGCDGKCRFEQDQRATSLKMSFDGSICSPNALGGAIINGTAQQQLQMSIDTGVMDGSMTVMLTFFGLDDLTGTKSTAPFSVGVLHGTPVSGTNYNGTSDLDWWYTTDSVSIDPNRLPLSSLPASFSAGTLSAGPGTVTLNLVLGGSPAALTMYDAKLAATSNAASAPTQSTTMTTPGHLPGEHDDPTLKTFASLAGGKLCGNVSAASLAAVAVPMAIETNCDEGYSKANGNTLLDAIVGGCTKTVLFFPVTVIQKTQPDQSTDGNQYTLTMSGTHVTGCSGGAAWPTCLDKAAYSSAFQFSGDRVIAK